MTMHTGDRYVPSWTSARTHASKVEADHAARIAAGQASLRAAVGMVGILAEGGTPDPARLGMGIPRQGGHPLVEQRPAPEPVLPAQRGVLADADVPDPSAASPRAELTAGLAGHASADGSGLLAAGLALLGRRRRTRR